MKIVLLAGGQSPERAVSQVTGKAVKNALEDLGHRVTWVDPGLDLPQVLWQERQAGCEFVWIALHGGGGEDGRVQALLDWLGLPYQGSGYLASALAMDKAIAKQLFRAQGIPTPAAWVWEGQDCPTWGEVSATLGSPVVIKPVDGGSTVGVTIASHARQFEEGMELAQTYGQRLLLETYIAGKELTLSILQGQVMPAIEIITASGGLYDYAAKYEPGGSRHLIPCSLSPDGLAAAEQVALAAYQALGCQGLARVDLRIDSQEQPWVLEINTLPGMTPTSLCPDAAAALGWTFGQLVERILQVSLTRFHGTPSASSLSRVVQP
ncbi:MAG: D-alanine--D-alanine ligase [Cyanobacteriota bacterium]|nr:D-alanine--D-alanine ligase [Cyanobacteriota bacterium]